MMGSLMILVGIAGLCIGAYDLGKVHGYDQWDKENDEFQEGLKKCK